jgi:hypothetical protein
VVDLLVVVVSIVDVVDILCSGYRCLSISISYWVSVTEDGGVSLYGYAREGWKSSHGVVILHFSLDESSGIDPLFSEEWWASCVAIWLWP